MRLARKQTLSSALVFSFFGVLLTLGLIGEFFQSQERDYDLARLYANPLVLTPFKQLRKIKLVNRFGEFVMENQSVDGDWAGPWQLTSPQSLKVKDGVLNQVLQSLENIHVRNFFKNEPINVSSFSLDRPTLTILLESFQGKTAEVSMGLINPIDQSAYLLISDQDQIYQIEPFDYPLENWDLTSLVESKIFAFGAPQLLSIEIYKGNPPQSGLHLYRQDQNWLERTNGPINEIKLEAWIQDLNEIKSLSVLENLSDEVKLQLDEAFQKPGYSFKVATAQGKTTYYLTQVDNSLPLKIDSKPPYWILTQADKKHFMVVDKSLSRWLETDWNYFKPSAKDLDRQRKE